MPNRLFRNTSLLKRVFCEALFFLYVKGLECVLPVIYNIVSKEGENMYTILKRDDDASNSILGCFFIIGLFKTSEEAQVKIPELVEEDCQSLKEECDEVGVQEDIFGCTNIFASGDLVITYQVKEILDL